VFAPRDVIGCRELCVAFILKLGIEVRENFRQTKWFIIFRQQNPRKVTHIRIFLVSAYGSSRNFELNAREYKHIFEKKNRLF
jgi:hypothetical protein